MVDADDRVVGHADRFSFDYRRDIYRVTALWITNSQGEVLLCQRKLTKKHDPGKWGPGVAGTVEEGETYESNMYKELGEEIGLTGYPLTRGPKQFVDGPKRYFCQWFLFTVDLPAEALRLQEDEVEAAEWIPLGMLLDELAKLPDKYVPAMYEGVPWLLAELEKSGTPA